MTYNPFTVLRVVATGVASTPEEARMAGAAISILEQVVTDLHRIAAALEEANRIAVAIEGDAAMRRQQTVMRPFDIMQQQDP